MKNDVYQRIFDVTQWVLHYDNLHGKSFNI